MSNAFRTIILAAGQGTRMKSDLPKVLHKIFDKPLLSYVVESSLKSGSKNTAVIIGNGAELVKKTMEDEFGGLINFYVQEERKGTGHAVKMANEYIDNLDKENPDASIVVLCGDTPLIKPETLTELVDAHTKNGNFATVISAVVDEPKGYGRVLKGKNEEFLRIVEEKDADEETKKIKNVNTGVFCYKVSALKSALGKLTCNNAQNEYYLTDVIEIIKNDGGKTGILEMNSFDEFIGINDRVHLSDATAVLRRRINEEHMMNGVTIVDSLSTSIYPGVEIGKETVIQPGTIIKGKTKIGELCDLGPYTQIKDSTIGDNTKINNSVIENADIGSNVTMGPYVHIRPDSRICDNAKLGNFVEIKNAVVGEGSKVPHLSYVGDTDMGSNVNMGCGTVTVNYDGKNKYRTIIGDNVFVGCNSNLVAPVTIESNSYVAAGSTITENVPENNLAIARARQVNKQNWNDRRN